MCIRTSVTVFSIGFLTVTAGCTKPSSLPGPEPSPAESGVSQPAQPESIDRSSSRSWQILPTSETLHYTTSTTTVIQQSMAPLNDSVTTQIQYSISINRSPNSTSFNGSIEAFSAKAGNRIGSDQIPSSFPISFTGQLQNHNLIIDPATSQSNSSSSLPCEAAERTPLSIIERNFVAPPLQLHPGMTWQDSLSTTSCTGSLRVDLTTLRTYKVIGAATVNNVAAILIGVTEKTLSAGEGSQDQHRLIVKTEGAKAGTLAIDQTTGSLISFSTEAHTILQIQSSGRTQQFSQNSKELTTRM